MVATGTSEKTGDGAWLRVGSEGMGRGGWV